MSRYKKNHSEQTKETLIHEASKLLRSQGFDGVSVAEVMKTAGLTHGGFYAHFKDKNDLLIEALQEALKESPANFKYLGELVIQKQTLAPIVMGYLSEKRVHNIADGCPAAALSSEIPRQSDEIKTIFKEGLIETVDTLTEILQQKQTKAWATFSMLYGALALMRILEDETLKNDIRKDVLQSLEKIARP